MLQFSRKFFFGYGRLVLIGFGMVSVWIVPLTQALGQGARVGEADAVYQNGFVYTVDAVASRAQAFAVRDGKFLAVGSNADMKAHTGPDTKVVDLKGKMVMPGIVDGHIHPVRGALTKMGVKFEQEATVDEIKAKVKQYIADKKLKKGEWVEGGKWGQDYKTLNAKMLDDIAPDNPVFLHDWSNHLGWVNSAALKAAGITKDTPDPKGGVIDRDSSGNPTGTLHDKALGVIVAKMPLPTEELLEKRTAWIFDKLNSFGITHIATAQLDTTRLKVFRTLESQGKLTVRIKGHWDWNTRYSLKSLEDMAKVFDSREKRGPVTALIDPDGVKIYSDGVPNGHGVPMLESYIDELDYGEQQINEATLRTWVQRFDAMGLNVMVHAIGEMSNRHVLDAVEATRKANGKGPRHHMAHAFYVNPADIPRFAELDVAAELSVYAGWIPTPTAEVYAHLIGRERQNQLICQANSLTKAGAIVAWGTDWENIPEPDPWFAMEGMITRMHPGKPEMGILVPSERVDRDTAIAIFTINGAMLNEAEDVTGSIEPGKSADFIVINQNLLEIPAENIHKTKVLKTVLQGKTVYEHKL